MTQPADTSSSKLPIPLGPLTPDHLLWIMRGCLALVGLLTFVTWWHVSVNAPAGSSLGGDTNLMSSTATLFDRSTVLALLVLLLAWGSVGATFFTPMIPRAPLVIAGGAVAAFLFVLISALSV